MVPKGADTPELRRLAHNIAGAAGTFGYAALSAAAGAVDDCYALNRVPDTQLLDILDRELAAVAGA